MAGQPHSDQDAPALTRAVAEAVDRHGLLPAGPVVIAFSGGPDSLCLLHALADLAPRRGWRLIAAHLDHGLRPESAAEVETVRALAAARRVPLRAERADVPALAAGSGRGVEATARRARYRFLARMAAEHGDAPVAIAHTRDDQAETLLLRLARGAGLTGLAAMRPLTTLLPDAWGEPADAATPPLRVVRPLLGIGRAEIEAELVRRGLTPLRDPSNADPAYARNRLRHHLLPAWQALDPGIAARLARTADLLAADEEALTAATEQAWARATMRQPDVAASGAVAFDRAAFLAEPLALRRRLLRRAADLLGGATPALAAVDGALAASAGHAGGQADVGDGLALVVEAARLWIARLPIPTPDPDDGISLTPGARVRLEPDGTTMLPGGGTITCRRIAPGDCDRPLTGRHAHFRAALSDAAPVLRTWRPGDRIALPHLAGHKKLSDLFIDRKVPRAQRATLPLLVAGGAIAWIVGHAVGDGFRATGNEPVVLCCTAEERTEHSRAMRAMSNEQ